MEKGQPIWQVDPAAWGGEAGEREGVEGGWRTLWALGPWLCNAFQSPVYSKFLPL